MLSFSCFVINYLWEKDSYNVFDKYSERSRFPLFYFNISSFFNAPYLALKSTISCCINFLININEQSYSRL